MIEKALRALDFLPGWKANTGAVVVALTSLAQLLGADQPLVELVKSLATALLIYGVAMKNARK